MLGSFLKKIIDRSNSQKKKKLFMYNYDKEYFKSKPKKKLRGNSLDGGELYNKPDYYVNE